jgi:CRISPR-associated protein Cmr3
VTTRLGLVLEPLDLLFFRDGRPFEAGLRLGSTTIFPQTLAGALRTSLLEQERCDFAVLGIAMRSGKPFREALAEQPGALAEIAAVSAGGPWFWRENQPLVPVPAVLLRSESHRILRLAPLKAGLPGWRPEEPGMLPLWARSAGGAERFSGYLTLSGLERFLRGDVPDGDEIVDADTLFETEARTGIAVGSETMTATAGMIYSADYLALKPRVSLYAELSGPEAVLTGAFKEDRAIPFGGQGRYVRARRLPEPTQWPRPQREGAGTLLLLTTPAPFATGWRPQGLDLVAAAVPGYVSVSGWDLARGGPKPTRFAATAGAVYFCRGTPSDGESLCEAEDALVGWGRFLQGVWDYA